MKHSYHGSTISDGNPVGSDGNLPGGIKRLLLTAGLASTLIAFTSTNTNAQLRLPHFGSGQDAVNLGQPARLPHFGRNGQGVAKLGHFGANPHADFRLSPRTETDARSRAEFVNTRSFATWKRRQNNILLFANSHQDMTPWLSEIVASTWQDARNLNANWFSLPARPNLDQHGVNVVLDDSRSFGDATPVSFHSDMAAGANVFIHTDGGQISPDDLEHQIRTATTYAFFHVHRLDDTFPTWVRDGLADYIASTRSRANPDLPPAIHGGQPQAQVGFNRFANAQRQDISRADAVDRVRFLLTAHDGKFAGDFAATMRGMVERAGIEGPRLLALNEPDAVQHRFALARSDKSDVDALLAANQKDFYNWRKEPLSGQPQVEFTKDASPEERRQQAKLATIMKLGARLIEQPDEARIQPKIISFKDTQQETKPTPQPASDAAMGPSPYDRQQIARKISFGSGTSIRHALDDTGRLQSLDNHRSITQILDLEDHHYTSKFKDGKWKLIYDYDRHRLLEGWLEPNEEDPSRPNAKFAWRKKT